MRSKRIVAMGLLMTALTVLVFVGDQAAAEPDVNAGATTGESSPSPERRAKIAAGPNANAVLSLDIDASGNKMDDGNTSGTIGAGTDTVVVEVFISGLAGPINGGLLSFDTDMLTVKSVAVGKGLLLDDPATTASISIGIIPADSLTNGHFATVTFMTDSDVTGMEFKVGASVKGLAAASGGRDTLIAEMPLTFNAPTTGAAGPNANAVLSLDIDASGNKMDDGNTSGTVAGSGTDVVVEVFISGLAGPISGGVLSFDTDMLTVKSVAVGKGFLFGNTDTTASIGIIPADSLTNGHFATVTFMTASDVTGMEFQVGASVSNLAAASGETDMLTAEMPLTFNAPTTGAAGPNANAVLSLDIDDSGNKMDDGNTSGTIGAGTDVVVEVFISRLAGPISGGVLSFDTDMLTVKSVAVGAGTLLGTATTANISIDIIPAADLTNDHLATVTFMTASDVTGMEFKVGASVSNLAAASGGRDTLIAAIPLTFNTPTPDFDGDGTVGFSDFLAVAGQYGTRKGDGIYQARYDLNSDGAIDVSDILIFAGSFGGPVSPPGGGGVSSRPDLIVESPSVSDNTLTTGQSFTLRATVRNSGTGQSASTTLRYYRSSDSTISTSDTEVDTDSVSGLAASATRSDSISLRAPSSAGTYYYGACVASVSGESNSNNNCSTGVRVTVSSGSGGGGSSRPDLIVQSPSVSDSTLMTGQSFTLHATVRNSGTGRSASTTLRYYRSVNPPITAALDTEVGMDSISGLSASATSAESISLTAPSSAGTYYYGACVASVREESNTRNNCSDGVRVTVSSGGGG